MKLQVAEAPLRVRVWFRVRPATEGAAALHPEEVAGLHRDGGAGLRDALEVNRHPDRDRNGPRADKSGDDDSL